MWQYDDISARGIKKIFVISTGTSKTRREDPDLKVVLILFYID
jgi:hypothetical protein